MERLSIRRLEDNSQSAAREIVDDISIGRSSANDIVVDADRASRRHCVISLDQSNNVFVTDLDSGNGTYINDKKITKFQVHPDDVLQVGAAKFIFTPTQKSDLRKAEPGPKKVIPEKIKKANSGKITKVIKPIKPGNIKLRSIISDESTRKKIESIVIKSDENSPKKYRCPVNSIYTIGRLHFSDIFIDSNSISRSHARIDVRENHAIITDTHSTNGTYVNDEKITSKELQDGDTIKVGTKQLTVSFATKSDSGFASYKKNANFNTIDLLKEQSKILEIFKDEYGERVLLEVERQTLLFCLEFENYLKKCDTVNSRRNIIVKMVHLLSNPVGIADGSTLEMLIGNNGEKEVMASDFLRRAQSIMKNGTHSKIVYFEEPDTTMPKSISMNGLALDFNEELKILVFGIPYDNLSYLAYESTRLMLDQI